MTTSSTLLIRLIGVKGTVVNRVLPSLHGGLFEITNTAPKLQTRQERTFMYNNQIDIVVYNLRIYILSLQSLK